MSTSDFETACVTCGGRGGWWTRDRRDICSRCKGNGWEPSTIVQRLLRKTLGKDHYQP